MENIITHKKWLLNVHPYVFGKDIEDYVERQKQDNANKEKRHEMLQQFMTDETSVGWKLKKQFDEITKKTLVDGEVDAGHKLHKYLKMNYSILPSFFKFYTYLANALKEEAHDEEAKKVVANLFSSEESKSSVPSKLDFKLIFRTFGSDHFAIYEEFMEFLHNKHPLFPNPNPVTDTHEHEFGNCGNFLRSTDNSSDIVLISGMFPNKAILKDVREYVFDKSLGSEELNKKVIDHLEAQEGVKFNKDVVQVHRNIKEIDEYLMQNQGKFIKLIMLFSNICQTS